MGRQREDPAEFERMWQRTESGPVWVKEQPWNAPELLDPPLWRRVAFPPGSAGRHAQLPEED